MKRVLVLMSAVFALTVPGLTASADGDPARISTSAAAAGAQVLRWSGEFTGPNSWTNPCTGEDVVLISTAEVGGVVVRDPTGEVHARGYSNLVDGVEYERVDIDVAGDPTGWVVSHLRVNNSAGGIENPDTGAAHFLWQLHITVEDPVTGQRYKAVFFSNIVMSATGELVLDRGTTAHNTCLGIPG